MFQQQPQNQFGKQQHYQGNNQQTDSDFIPRGDESLPWRQPKSSRIRSRSLQPKQRNIEDYPWLRQRRDRSLPKQETFLRGQHREPIRPWIEEVICLKKSQIKRKIIEHEQLEKVFLKASQIERREIIREQLQKIDLKSVQKYFEKANMTNILEQIQESLLSGDIDDSKLQQLKQVEEISILELTRQIDELVKKDTISRGEIKDQKVQKVQRIGKSEEIVFKETETEVEDTIVLRLDRQDEVDLQQIQPHEMAVPWERGRKKTVDRSRQAVSHTEQSTLLRLNQNLEVQTKRIEQMEQEQAVAWRRGGRPQGGSMSHIEDSTILNVDESRNIMQTQEYVEQPVAWSRGPKKPEESSLSYIEDSTMLNVDQSMSVIQKEQMIEQAVAWRRGPKKPEESTLSNIDDSTMLNVDQSSNLIQKEQMIEQPVAWRRGPKRPEQPAMSYIEDSTMLNIDQSSDVIQQEEIIEQPVAWRRGPKQPEPTQSHIEDTNILTTDTPEEVEQLEETPVAWRRGKKPQQQQPQEIIQPTEPEVPQVVEKTLPWMRGKKQQPKDKEPAEQVQLKPIPRKQSIPKQQQESLELVAPQHIDEIQPETVVSEEPQQPAEAAPWRRVKKQKPTEQNPVEDNVVEEPAEELDEEIEEEEILEQPQQKSVKPKKKISKKKKLKHTESESVEELPDEDIPADKPTETIVPDEVTETVAANEPVKQFILKEVKETTEVVEKKKVKVIKLDTPQENVEDIPAEEVPIEEAQIVEEPDDTHPVTVEQVDVKKKKIIKRKVKKQKSVAFNDELQTFEAEMVDDETLIEESQTSIQLKQGEVKPVMVEDEEEIEELEYDEVDFKTEMDVKMTSNIIKKNKKRIHIDDSQPLPELELITQKRVQEVFDRVAEEEVIEDQLIKDVEESVSNVTLPEKKLVKTKPAVIKPPRFIKKLQPALCQPDQPTVLQCKIDGSPYPIVKWYFNDHELFASEKYIMQVVEKVATLEIVRVTPMDVGIYTCQAKNEAGVATSRTNLALGKFSFS